jgi:hypothetical protein
MTTETHTQSESRPVSPSVGRDARIARLIVPAINHALANIVDEDRISHRELKRREAAGER